MAKEQAEMDKIRMEQNADYQVYMIERERENLVYNT